MKRPLPDPIPEPRSVSRQDRMILAYSTCYQELHPNIRAQLALKNIKDNFISAELFREYAEHDPNFITTIATKAADKVPENQ